MRPATMIVLLTSMLAVGGCERLLNLDGLAYDLASSAAGGHGGDVSSASGPDGGTSPAANGAGGGLPRAATPIEVDQQPTGVTVKVPGSFELGFPLYKNFQLGHWFDVTSSPGADLAPTPAWTTDVIYSAFASNFGGVWYEADEAGQPSVQVIDRAPAFVQLHTTMEWAPHGGPIKVDVDYTIWASGLIGIRSVMYTANSFPTNFDDLETHYVSVAQDTLWSAVDLHDGLAASLRRTAVAPESQLLVLNHDDSVALFHDEPMVNRYWYIGPIGVAPSVPIERIAELQIAPSGVGVPQAAERVTDVLNPDLINLTGVDTWIYDPASANYSIDASTGEMTFAVSPTHFRHRPAFVIRDWSADAWQLVLDGETIASSSRPLGDQVITRHDVDESTLTIVYLGAFGQMISVPDRTFHLSAL